MQYGYQFKFNNLPTNIKSCQQHESLKRRQMGISELGLQHKVFAITTKDCISGAILLLHYFGYANIFKMGGACNRCKR
jgi:hypothetical protein